MNRTHFISPEYFTLELLQEIIGKKKSLELSREGEKKVLHCRKYLEKKLIETNDLFYGINTGFGSLCDIQISPEQVEELQYFLIQSHACGTGEEVPSEIVRIMMLLKVQSLSYGFSGVRLELVNKLIRLFNEEVIPVVFQQGSLGASGDLAPLAHLSLPLVGLGQVWYQGEKRPAQEVLEELKIEPLFLQAKEGLALLNGTQFSAAYGCWAILEAQRLFNLATLCGALSLDAFDCYLSPFDEKLHRNRPHKGQVKVAEDIRRLLLTSEIANHQKSYVQDPYAFRCIPQVHGASFDAMEHVKGILLTEINSVTDNPNIFPDEDAILSGGNFHAQPIALGMDYLAIAVAELGSISERRTFQLLAGKRGLPNFLTPKPGLHSGLMIPQYTAASIVSQNKQYCTPASVDTIPSSNGQEDHVSMAANAATKLYKVVKNVETILAIEFMTSAQALEFRRPLRSSGRIEAIIKDYRSVVHKLGNDRVLSEDIESTRLFLKKIKL